MQRSIAELVKSLGTSFSECQLASIGLYRGRLDEKTLDRIMSANICDRIRQDGIGKLLGVILTSVGEVSGSTGSVQAGECWYSQAIINLQN